MRVIVTGSREWTDARIIADALQSFVDVLEEGKRLTVVHGGARGADRIAGDWAQWALKSKLPVTRPEVHLARWSNPCRRDNRCSPAHRRVDPVTKMSTCPTAGYYRNEDMVALGADFLLAFVLPCRDTRCRKKPQPHPTHGSDQCIHCARLAGIEVVPFPGAGLETIFTDAR
jgi:hypothetical protein